MMRRLFDAARDFVAPPDAVCLGCGDRTGLDAGPWLCERCRRRLRPAWHALKPEHLRPGLSAAYFSAYYEPPISGLIKAVKFGGVWRAAPFLAECLTPLLDKMPLDTYDALMAVPLHPSRQRRRGFNQAELIARTVSDRTGIPLAGGLRRARATHAQARTRYHERAANVAGAFTCAGRFDGLRILLVDDVLTTGATLSACAQALRQAGAADVQALTVAGSRHFRLHAGRIYRKA